MYDGLIHFALRSRCRDRIESSRRERPAPEDPPGRHGRPSPCAMQLNGLPGILGTRGVETTLPSQPPGQGQLVQPDQGDHSPPHRCPGDPQEPANGPHGPITPARVSNSSISATRSCVLLPRMAPLATKAMSYPSRARGATSRHAAFRMRRARFRGTAPPTRRPTTNAVIPDPGATNTTIRDPFNGLPEDRTLPTAGSRVDGAYAESRERPLALRLARIARPARLRIRRRNPWVFLRRRLFGWKVRLDIDSILFGGAPGRGRAGEVYGNSIGTGQRHSLGRKCVKSHRRTGPVEGPVL
jgi:hypothetical protein